MSLISELSRITGVSDKSLYNFKKRGILPDSENLEDLIKAVIVYYKDLLNKKEQRSGDPLVEQKIRLTEAQANKFELENQLKAGDLIEAKEVESTWIKAVLTAKSRLLSIPSGLSPELARESDANKICNLLENRIHEALEELACYSNIN